MEAMIWFLYKWILIWFLYHFNMILISKVFHIRIICGENAYMYVWNTVDTMLNQNQSILGSVPGIFSSEGTTGKPNSVSEYPYNLSVVAEKES